MESAWYSNLFRGILVLVGKVQFFLDDAALSRAKWLPRHCPKLPEGFQLLLVIAGVLTDILSAPLWFSYR